MDNQTQKKLQAIVSLLRAGPGREHSAAGNLEESADRRFVTISRQAGAGGRSLGNRLVDRLNEIDPGSVPWTCWDKELTEKIAADDRLSKTLLDSLEERDHSWLGDFFTSLAFQEGRRDADEFKLYRRVAAAIRGIVQAGRVVIVGRGGAHITAGVPNGIHVRLVAPFAHRVARMTRQLEALPDAAAAHVRQLDRNRDRFHKRYFPGRGSSPESYTITLNTAEVDEEGAVECLVPLVMRGVHAGATA